MKDMSPGAKVFGLKPSSISGKIEHFARKAGVNLHCHQFRHRFATKLIERGANIRAVQQLMRHGDLSATEVYLSVKQRGLREAIDLLEGPGTTSNGAEPKGRQGVKPSYQEKELQEWIKLQAMLFAHSTEPKEVFKAFMRLAPRKEQKAWAEMMAINLTQITGRQWGLLENNLTIEEYLKT
jgi:hypothetical protein